MTSVKCRDCGGAVLQQSCDLCGINFRQEKQLEVHDKCEHILKTSEWSNCQDVQDAVTGLGSVLTTHHHLLVQCKQRLLQHADSCSTCKQSPLYSCSKQEMGNLRELLLPGSEELGWGEGGPLK